ncbi:hypothetical protein AAMO2058_000741900 [Amorphochlora amoebiformis]
MLRRALRCISRRCYQVRQSRGHLGRNQRFKSSTAAATEESKEPKDELGPMGLRKFDDETPLYDVLESIVEKRPDVGLTSSDTERSMKAFVEVGAKTLGETAKLSERQWVQLDELGIAPGTETVIKTILYGGFFPEYSTEVATRGTRLDFASRLKRNLSTQPFWKADSLGEPLPSSPHACSVSMPCWEHIVGYEEGDPEVWDALALGYPRFVVHPYIARLFRACDREMAKYGEACFAFPSERVAKRACDYIRHKNGSQTPLRIQQFRDTGIYAVIFPSGARDAVLKFWQHFGFVISSRWAEAILREHTCEKNSDFPTVDHRLVRAQTMPTTWGQDDTEYCTKPLECSIKAKTLVKQRLAAEASNCDPEDVYLYSSGMAAISSSLLAAQKMNPGCKSIQLGFPYLDVYKIQTVWGPGSHFISDMNPNWLDQVKNIVQTEQLSSVVIEFPGNPLLQTPDIMALSAILKENGVPLIVDDTIGSSANFNLIDHVDVVVTSLTKWFCGTGDVMAGSMILNRNSPFYSRFKSITTNEYEDMVYSEDAVALEVSSRTYIERMEKVNETTKPLVKFLREHKLVDKLWYPDSLQDPAIIKRGHSGLFSFVLENTEDSMEFFRNLEVNKGPSLGTNFTLACPYTLLAHYDELEWAEGLGISRHLIRVSTGLEEPEDLISRFDRALESIRR